MTRRAFNRVLLSLLLLIAQQLSIAHAMVHWGARVAVATAAQKACADGTSSKSVALEQGCDQCLAFAQIASAVGQEPRSFVAPSEETHAVACASVARARAHTPCGFRSRAPPAVVQEFAFSIG
jgi:hypothetical protein